jgi:hypothetical protein
MQKNIGVGKRLKKTRWGTDLGAMKATLGLEKCTRPDGV